MKRLFILIERPNGTTYEQEVEWRKGEAVETALNRARKMLGKSYWICDWWVA